MSDEEFDEESFRAYENELYGEQTDSEEDIDIEVEEALYGQVHYSFSLPNEEDLDKKDETDNAISSTPIGNRLKPDAEQQEDKGNLEVKNQDKNTDQIINISDYDDNGDDDKSAESRQENWELIDEDLGSDLPADGKRRPVKRYYKSATNQIRCHNCNEKGHMARDCPTPKKIACFLCGGEHIRRRCPNELCFNCHEPGHHFFNCKKPRTRPDDQCRRCHMTGHHYKDCPDRWRQFHRTTNARENPIRDRSNDYTGPIYCYNCSEIGHYGHECTQDRMEYHVAASFPFIVKYDGEFESHRQDNHKYKKKDNNRKRNQTYDGKTSRHFDDKPTERKTNVGKESDHRKSWPSQSHHHDQWDRIQGIERDIVPVNSTRNQHHQESMYDHYEHDDNNMKIGSKRKPSGTSYHGESKKTKQDYHSKNRKNKKNKDAQSDFHDQRIVELVYDDDDNDDCNHNQSSYKEKRHNKKKFNKRKSEPPDAFTRMVDDWEEKDTSQHHHSSPSYSHNNPDMSPDYVYQDHRTSQDYPQYYHKTSQNWRSSQGYNRNYKNTDRGFRSKKNKHFTM